MSPRMELIQNKRNPGVKVSVILLDWGVRESFHSLAYLNRQTIARADYELIWVELYDHKPQKLRHTGACCGTVGACPRQMAGDGLPG